MAIPNYPSVTITEKDLLTRIATGDNTSYGGIAINSTWGPCEEITLVTTENDLVSYFAKPNSNTYVDFFTASNFLTYSSALKVVRVCDSTAKNAAQTTAVQVKNSSEYDTATLTSSGAFIARYPGAKGNSLFIAACDSTASLTGNVNPTSSIYGTWSSYFSALPGTSPKATSMGGSLDELHIVIIDANGAFTGNKGTLLEKYAYLSKAIDAKKEDGSANYYKEVINQLSQYIRTGDTYILNANSIATLSNSFTTYGNVAMTLTGGIDISSSNTAMYVNAYDLFSDKKTVEVSHIMAGNIANTSIQSLITLAETRGDCIVYCSPNFASVQPGQTQSTIATNINNIKTNGIGTSSSYYVMDGNWKYQYDKYNDTNRWIPCNGDVAGLKAKAEKDNDSWWNGSGYNRGIIKNCIKLAWNPKDTYMGQIYQNSVNPIISDAGQFVLLGDKTGLTKPSAFDRINVRSLFNTLKKKIGDYLKYGMFEFNDEFTRAQLKAYVDTYLTSIKGRRGIEDFQVVCDLSNNTDIVRDNNQLVMDCYIKPTKSINYISLNMIAVGSTVQFSEVVGRV